MMKTSFAATFSGSWFTTLDEKAKKSLVKTMSTFGGEAYGSLQSPFVKIKQDLVVLLNCLGCGPQAEER
jgi:hypothetical protein